MVTQWQSVFCDDRFTNAQQKNPDYIKFSESMGVQAQRCIAPGDVEAKLEWLIESDEPALLDMVIDRSVCNTYFSNSSAFIVFVFADGFQGSRASHGQGRLRST